MIFQADGRVHQRQDTERTCNSPLMLAITFAEETKVDIFVVLPLSWFFLVFDFKEYQHCFHKTKQKLKQDPNEKQFEFSEMYIFGKFETFHRRLAKILDIFTTFKTYSVLQDSKIEGLEDMATKYQVLFQN